MAETELPAPLKIAIGASGRLDRAVARTFDVPMRDYSSSVDACLQLIHEKLPKAHWHVGRTEDGVSLYASLSQGRRKEESTSGTVPLALLNVVVKFLAT